MARGFYYRMRNTYGRERTGQFVIMRDVPRGDTSIAGPLQIANSPYLFQNFARPVIRQLMEEARYMIFDDVSQQVRDRLKNGIDIYSKSIYSSERDKAALAQMHETLANEMHREIMDAFEESGIGKKRPSYRWADTGKLRRYSNKALRRAIQSKGLIEYDYTGIAMNVGTLDDMAIQWYKLNFGAGPRGEASPKPVTPNIRFGKFPTNTNVNLNGFEPSANFYVPGIQTRGYWSTKFSARTNYEKLSSTKKPGFMGPGRGWAQAPRKGEGALYVLGRGWSPLGFEARLSKGIHAHRFLDAGTQHFNRVYGQRTSKVFDAWHRKAIADGRVAVERTNQRNRIDLEIGPI